MPVHVIDVNWHSFKEDKRPEQRILINNDSALYQSLSILEYPHIWWNKIYIIILEIHLTCMLIIFIPKSPVNNFKLSIIPSNKIDVL